MSRSIKREKASLPVDVRRSKTSLLKLPIGDESEKSRFQFCSQALAVSQSILIQDFVSATNFDENILLLAFSKFSLLDEIFDMVVKRCPNCDQTVSNK